MIQVLLFLPIRCLGPCAIGKFEATEGSGAPGATRAPWVLKAPGVTGASGVLTPWYIPYKKTLSICVLCYICVMYVL